MMDSRSEIAPFQVGGKDVLLSCCEDSFSSDLHDPLTTLGTYSITDVTRNSYGGSETTKKRYVNSSVMSAENKNRQEVPELKPVRLRTPVSSPAGKDKCVRQALAARENRLKKKKEMQRLKAKVIELSEANAQLKKQVSPLQENILELEDEVLYLKSVLDNQASLAGLLKNIPLGNVQLSSRYKRKRQQPIETGEEPSQKASGGLCIHVRGDESTPELCRKCSHQAAS